MGLFTRSTKPSDELLEHGIRGTATVEKADMAGMITEYDGYMSKKKQEELLTGERSMTKYKLQLQVEVHQVAIRIRRRPLWPCRR